MRALKSDILILRHGETEWNRVGRMQGALDSPLTELGRAQAKQQGRILRGLGLENPRWYVSPQGRAQQTARLASEMRAADLTDDPRLREIGMGDWSGMTRAQIADTRPDLFEDKDLMAYYGEAPGGECLQDLERRVTAFLDDIEGPTVIVTHGITSRALRCALLGIPVQRFHELGGGQGVVYRLSGAGYDCLTPDGAITQTRPG